MTGPWQLPRTMELGGREYAINADFRRALEIIRVLEDPQYPEFFRWQVALALFCDEEIPDGYLVQAMEFLGDFLRCGAPDTPGPKLLDWQQDAQVILSDVNRVAGREVREAEFIHWWTFLGWFHAIGQGQLATLVSIRDKLRRGQKLEHWEQEYYRQNKPSVDLKPRRTAAEQAQIDQLQHLLDRQPSAPA